MGRPVGPRIDPNARDSALPTIDQSLESAARRKGELPLGGVASPFDDICSELISPCEGLETSGPVSGPKYLEALHRMNQLESLIRESLESVGGSADAIVAAAQARATPPAEATRPAASAGQSAGPAQRYTSSADLRRAVEAASTRQNSASNGGSRVTTNIATGVATTATRAPAAGSSSAARSNTGNALAASAAAGVAGPGAHRGAAPAARTPAPAPTRAPEGPLSSRRLPSSEPSLSQRSRSIASASVAQALVELQKKREEAARAAMASANVSVGTAAIATADGLERIEVQLKPSSRLARSGTLSPILTSTKKPV